MPDKTFHYVASYMLKVWCYPVCREQEAVPHPGRFCAWIPGSDESSVFGVCAGCVSEFEIHAVRLYILGRKDGIQVDILA